MNRKERRIKRSQDKHNAIISLRGRPYTLEEAGALAINEQSLGNFQAAIDIYHLILAKAPSNVEAYINRGTALHALKRFDDALASYDKAIALKPDYAEAYINQGNAMKALTRFDDALVSYEKAIALKPGYAEAYNNRGNALQALERFDDALASYDKAIELKLGYAEAFNNRGITLHALKRFDDALASYDKAIALKPGNAGAYINRGNTLISKGDLQEAEKMFLKALALKPDFPESLFGLANIRKYQDADHAFIKNFQTLLGKPGNSIPDREYLYFSLGKIHDDCGHYDDAFECYREANEIRSARVSYNSGKVTAITNNIIEVFSKDFLAQPFAFASDSKSPLFIAGMPRSGTTLMANILSNHRSIDTAGELSTIAELTSRLPQLIKDGTPYPQAAKYITADIASRLISDYEKRLRRDTDANVPHVIDKHPLNFMHLGFISMLFPESRIIHCMRHPLDTCLSNYFQRFALKYDYSFDLRNIGHFYREYIRIMEHWRKVPSMKMIEINYEDIITNTEQTVEKILDFLELEWDERCLTPHTNPCAVETASSWQARQPIYQQSVGRWRHYEKYLTSLKEILQL